MHVANSELCFKPALILRGPHDHGVLSVTQLFQALPSLPGMCSSMPVLMQNVSTQFLHYFLKNCVSVIAVVTFWNHSVESD